MRSTAAGTRQGLIDAAPDGIVTVDAHGRIIEFNAAAERMFGISREDAIGGVAGELVVPGREPDDDDWNAFRKAVSGRDLSLPGRRLELTAARADGSEFPIELAITRTNGDPPQFTGWVRDISEQRAREARGERHSEIDRLLARRRGDFAGLKLTPRELEILQLAAKGHSGRRIAESLVITPATVKTHFENVYEKLRVRDRTAAVAEALRRGLIE
jgi:PAS domain S-box-containing protein